MILFAPCPAASAFFSVASTFSFGTSKSFAFLSSNASRVFVSGDVECVGWFRTAASISRDRMLYMLPFAWSFAPFLCLILDHCRERLVEHHASKGDLPKGRLTLLEPEKGAAVQLNALELIEGALDRHAAHSGSRQLDITTTGKGRGHAEAFVTLLDLRFF